MPEVGDVVTFISRERWILATERGLPLEPHAAIVARVNRDKAGELTGKATLVVFDPEHGDVVRRDIQFSEHAAPETFIARPAPEPAPPRQIVPVETLKLLIQVAVEEAVEKAMLGGETETDKPQPAADDL